MALKWKADLKSRPDDMVNSVAISDDAGRLVAGTYYHNYSRVPGPSPVGTYRVSCFDANGGLVWMDSYASCFEGVYSVAISGDGKVAAAGGWLANDLGPKADQGLLCAYDAALGTRLLDYRQIPDRVSSVALSADGSVLAAAADKLYVFWRAGQSFSTRPAAIPLDPKEPMTGVAVHPSGAWLVACDLAGHVCLAELGNQAIAATHTWTAPQTTHFHAVAISRDAESFAAGGSKAVYYFTKNSMMANPPAPLTKPFKAKGSVRWVSISGDGARIAAVANDGQKGLLMAFSNSTGKLKLAWQKGLRYKPNGVSMDAAVTYIAAADGYDSDQVGGTFYLYDSNGHQRWQEKTTKMNWPAVISANGAGVAGGSDDGFLYAFQP